MSHFDSTVADWLDALNIKISRHYLKQKLQTHPDYPSMLSIAETLEELGIEYAAIQIEKEQLPEMPVPFLAHLHGNGGEWVLVKNRDNLDKQFLHFFERWQGTALAAEKKEGWRNKENELELGKDAQKQRVIIATIGWVSLLTLIGLLFSGTLLTAGLMLTIVSGILINWLIVSKDLGIESTLVDRVCGPTADCNAVIQSKGAKFPGGLSWGDIGLTWFLFQFLFLSVSMFTGELTQLSNLLSLLSILYFPFAAFSLFYQWRIAKKWCRLCLVVVGILLGQSIILLPQIGRDELLLPAARTVFLASLVFSISAIGWIVIKSLLKNRHELQNSNWNLQRFNNNADLFVFLLRQQRKINITPWLNDLQIGNAKAGLQIMVACNPYCKPCTHAHKILHELIESNTEVGLTIRFNINSNNKEDPKTKAIEYLLQLVAQKKEELSSDELIFFQREMLCNWFKWMDNVKFEANYPLITPPNVDELLIQQDQWCKESKIMATPTLFVNGYELPNVYRIVDLPRVVRRVKLEKPEQGQQSVTIEMVV